jgi:hypothetical protein
MIRSGAPKKPSQRAVERQFAAAAVLLEIRRVPDNLDFG